MRIKMAAPAYRRVLVHIQKSKETKPSPIEFTQSMVDLFGGNDNATNIGVRLEESKLILSEPSSDIDNVQVVKMKRPKFCPIFGLGGQQLPEDIRTRGIDVGAVSIVESGDGCVLLIRRPKNLRTFPGIWVPPGGHVEEKETLEAAALRELHEEAGLKVTSDMCDRIPILAAWESVYPPSLAAGLPKRHHAIVFLHVKLRPQYTASHVTSMLKPDPVEVDACAWLSRNIIEAVVAADEESDKTGSMQGLPETFSALTPHSDGSTIQQDLQTSVLLNKYQADQADGERVSTATKYALQEWLNATK